MALPVVLTVLQEPSWALVRCHLGVHLQAAAACGCRQACQPACVCVTGTKEKTVLRHHASQTVNQHKGAATTPDGTQDRDYKSITQLLLGWVARKKACFCCSVLVVA